MKLENIIPLLYFILCFFCFVLFIFFILFLLIKKLSRPMYSNSISSSVLKDKQSNFLFSQSDQLNRFAEHYSVLASDVTQHSLDNEYWVSLFGTNPNNNLTWDINDSITMEEIQNTVLDMKNNKAPDPDGIPI